MRIFILSTMLLSLLVLTGFSTNGNQIDKRVIVVLVNGMSLENLQEMKQLENSDWADKGQIAAMNLRTAGSITDVNNMVTMSSGTRAIGVDRALEAFVGFEMVNTTGVQAKGLYQQLTGKQGFDQSIYILGYQFILGANKQLSYSVTPGLIGESLHEQGLTTAAIGSSDKGKNSIVRVAPLLVADSSGVVDRGDLGSNTLKKDDGHVYGIMTNYDYLLDYIKNDQDSSVIAVDLGDLYRLYSMRKAMEAGHFVQIKDQVLQEMNSFMVRLLASQRPGDLICFVSPMVNDEAEAKKSLMTPLIVFTPEGQSGTLTSMTTRQLGIVGNIDLAPTILNWLGIAIPDSVLGRTMNSNHTIQTFWPDWERIKHVYSTRGQVLYGYVSFQIAILIIATSLWFFAKPESRVYQWINQLIRFLLLVLTLSPFLLLVLPLFPTIQDVDVTITFLLILGTALSAALIRLPFAWIFFILSLVNWLPILIDGVFAHSFLMKQSYLGYDPVIGARYYGIGNEYMGVVIGSSILSFAMLLELMQKDTLLLKGGCILLFGIYLIFFALPTWGTNAGGALTAIAAYLASFYRLFNIPFDRRYFIWGIFAVILSIGTLFAVNLTGEEQTQTHIGRAMHRLIQGDFHDIWNIAQRKLEMNWHLIQVSSWSKVFITSLLVLGLFCYRRVGLFARLSISYPYAIRGFFGIIIGAFTALAVNDSGIVAAATTIIYMVVPLLYLGLEEKMG
ncbi:MAG TPA: hypothetical protein VJ824_07020 [Bacillota bacterium]|nr:hypothetical protein [Bacillota bacterium]